MNLYYIIWLIGFLYILYEVWIKGNKKLDMTLKIIWTLLGFFFGLITAIIYYVIYYIKK